VPNVSENFGSGPPSVAAMHFLRGATSDAPGDDAGRGSESAGVREGRAGASGLAGRIDDGVLVLVMFVMTMPVLVLHWFVEVFVLGSPSTAAAARRFCQLSPSSPVKLGGFLMSRFTDACSAQLANVGRCAQGHEAGQRRRVDARVIKQREIQADQPSAHRSH